MAFSFIQISFDYLCMSRGIPPQPLTTLTHPLHIKLENLSLKCEFIYTAFDASCCIKAEADELFVCENTRNVFPKHSQSVHKSMLPNGKLNK